MLLSGLIDGLITGSPDEEKVAFHRQKPYAHSGLHGAACVENSMSAFAAAVAAGHGIELDVHMSRDGTVIVFHDDELDRLTGQQGNVREMTAAQLCAIPLNGMAETIPTLDQVLRLVQGRVPILIEMKGHDVPVIKFCLAVRRVLEGYNGPVAIMSFNPDLCRWFHRHAQRIPHGLVMTQGSGETKGNGLRGRLARHLALWRANPEFLAYDIRDLPAPFPASQRKRGLPILTWTVRSFEQQQVAGREADQIIYEQPAR